MTARHCPGCRGYTADWAHACGGLPAAVPGSVREVVGLAIAAYADQLETGPGTGQPFRELPDMIAGALALAGMLAESAEPVPEPPR